MTNTTPTRPTPEKEEWEEALDGEPCGKCDGNGNVYADGQAHYMNAGVPTIACPACGGEGRIFDAETVRAAVRRALDERYKQGISDECAAVKDALGRGDL